MDIIDLSIGDWVCAEQLCGVGNEPRLTPPMKVVGLGDGAGGWVNLMIDPEQGDPFEFEPHEIRGIPITPEILEKNGFRQSKRFSKDWQLTVYNDEVYINLGDRYTTCEHNRMVHNPEDVSEVDYSNSLEMPRKMFVHELQRFLQLANVDKDIEL